MNIEEILALNDYTKIITLLNVSPKELDIETWRKEYDGDHAILTDTSRTDEYIGDGNSKRLVKKAKEIITFQKKITEIAIAFLFGEPVDLIHDGDEATAAAFDAVKSVWNDNKLDYFNRKLARAVFIETHAAELWYVRENPVTKTKELKVQLLSEKDGYKIFPHFNDMGDMDAFSVSYTVEELTATGEIKKIESVRIFTATEIITLRKESKGWIEDKKQNPFGKITVVYYTQDKPEWADAQSLIDRNEMLISRHADTDDYYSGPITKVKGKLTKMPDKDRDGKMLVLEGQKNPQTGAIEYGDVEYLTWDHSPESLKLEFENLRYLIHSMTSTPDISFDNVKGIGNISGIALKLMFLDPMLKATAKHEVFGEGLDRRINVIKAMLAVTDTGLKTGLDGLSVGVKFRSPLPDALTEIIEALVTARGGEAIMSREAAVAHNPLVEDAASEIERLEQEQNTTQSLGASYMA